MDSSLVKLSLKTMLAERRNTSYNKTIELIKEVSRKINLSFSKDDGDGRIMSAIKEKEYLDLLEKGLKSKDSTIIVERPKDRYWYDIRISTIPINLKITTGGTDNAFNKVAILYTISGEDTSKKCMNYNQWYKLVKSNKQKEVRNKMTEYHYLVVDKNSSKILLKSILDIHTFKSNPCNDLQINWKNEFKNIDYCINDLQFKDKVKELLKVIQKSVIQLTTSMNDFSTADIDKDFK